MIGRLRAFFPLWQGANGCTNPDELAVEVTRLEQKSTSLGRVVRWREQVTKAETMREGARREKECVEQILNSKTVELSRKTLDCVKLQEMSLMLAKEFAAQKLSTNMNLQEEETLELASHGNHGNIENAVDILTRCLILRNKSYKELMVQCNLVGRSESHL
ncbi:hypothetical protein GUJ93_ZPchr0009g1568 [Zizania palustris]|uniref:Uncharacterized protein n=1 Tax=Zizania palustris TaxID=103762 RepID=A0A8J5RM81_ZIZPA|nr:hypothetical protein GUJ93_ZPchr0009g1568 [Zizania palustris]